MIECYCSSTGVVITVDSSKHLYYFVLVLHQRMFLNRDVDLSVCVLWLKFTRTMFMRMMLIIDNGISSINSWWRNNSSFRVRICVMGILMSSRCSG